MLLTNLALGMALATTPYPGTYTVRAPAALASVASFAMDFLLEDGGDGVTRLSYRLPEEIVGPNKRPIVLAQTGPATNGRIPLSGELGHASCARSDDEMRCYVAYPGLPTDGAEDVVRERYADSSELSARLELAQLFGADPKGSLRIALP